MTDTPTSEAVQTEDTTTIETPPEDTTSQQTPPESTAADTTTETPATPPEKTYKDWREALSDADPDELLKDPRIEGRIGQVADKRARELDKQRAAAAEATRLRNLRKTDPLAFAQAVDEQESANDATAAQEQAQQDLLDRMMAPMNAHLQQTLPKDALEKLAGKQYTAPTHGEALQAYVDDIVSVRLDTEIGKARSKWEKEERPALRKQILAELNGGEDSSPGAVPTGRSAGQQYNSGLEASTALMEGQLSIDDFRRLTMQHPDWR